jgi:hypothetical protein
MAPGMTKSELIADLAAAHPHLRQANAMRLLWSLQAGAALRC